MPDTPTQSPDDRAAGGEKAARFDLLFVILVACLFSALHQYPMLLDYYSLDDDTRIMFFIYRDHDPELFTTDYTAGGLNNYAPWLVSRLYTLATYVMSPIAYSKLIPFLQIGAASAMFFLFALRAGWRRGGAWAAVLVFLLVCRWDQFYTGSWRGFAAPLIAGYLLLAQRERWTACALLGALSVIVYPVLLSAMTATTLLLLLSEMLRSPKEELPRLLRIAGTILGTGLAAAAVALFVIRYGSIYRVLTYEQVISMPETNMGGRFPIADYLNVSPSNVFTLSFLHRMFFLGRTYVIEGFAFYFVLFLVVIAGAFGVRHLEESGRYAQARLWRTVLLLAGAGVMTAGVLAGKLENLAGGLYLAAVTVAALAVSIPGLWERLGRVPKLFALGAFLCGLLVFVLHPWLSLRLYTASHQFRYVIPVMTCLAAARFLSLAWQERHLAAPAVSTGLFAAVAAAGLYHGEIADYVRCEDPPLYDFAAGLPKDALLAGHPEAADCLPIYSKRNSLIMYELSWPLFAAQWEDLKQRTYDIFTALYASGKEDIRPFCEKYPGAYIFALDRYYEDRYLAQEIPYFRPFDTFLKQYRGKPYWLRNPPPEYILKAWDGGRIVSCPSLFPDLKAEPAK